VEWSVIYWILSARVSLSFALVSGEWVLVSMNCPAGCRLAASQRNYLRLSRLTCLRCTHRRDALLLQRLSLIDQCCKSSGCIICIISRLTSRLTQLFRPRRTSNRGPEGAGMVDDTKRAPLAKDKERPNGKVVAPSSTAGRCEVGATHTTDERRCFCGMEKKRRSRRI
jgi:hypothetical protein